VSDLEQGQAGLRVCRIIQAEGALADSCRGLALKTERKAFSPGTGQGDEIFKAIGQRLLAAD